MVSESDAFPLHCEKLFQELERLGPVKGADFMRSLTPNLWRCCRHGDCCVVSLCRERLDLLEASAQGTSED